MAFSGLTGYDRDKGEGLWRRSLYTFWKRTVLSPAMQVFDASAREHCTVRDTRTNTPLQSLNLMNDVTYVEAARMLAQRMLTRRRRDAAGARSRGRFVWRRPAGPSERELQVVAAESGAQIAITSAAPAGSAKALVSGRETKRRET